MISGEKASGVLTRMPTCPRNPKRLIADRQRLDTHGFKGCEMKAFLLCLSNPTRLAGTNITKPQDGQTHTFAIGPVDLNVTECLGIH